jgi:hypothetical protein
MSETKPDLTMALCPYCLKSGVEEVTDALIGLKTLYQCKGCKRVFVR